MTPKARQFLSLAATALALTGGLYTAAAGPAAADPALKSSYMWRAPLDPDFAGKRITYNVPMTASADTKTAIVAAFNGWSDSLVGNNTLFAEGRQRDTDTPAGKKTLYGPAIRFKMVTQSEMKRETLVDYTSAAVNKLFRTVTNCPEVWAGKSCGRGLPMVILLNKQVFDAGKGYTAAQQQMMISHEIGHALGLDHSKAPYKCELMLPWADAGIFDASGTTEIITRNSISCPAYTPLRPTTAEKDMVKKLYSDNSTPLV
ncbi:hypothetical protein [Streptomyces sp. NPDC005533]|uniref:hypothetical protein n=1 Tax=Streptomyces sp. NPDC005533 TaxID=3364723 RepID=UPI0036B85B4E